MRLLLRSLLLILIALCPLACMAGETLEKSVILTRHGVRAAMSSQERLESFSLRRWPRFEVPPGQLTARGAELERLLGDYYRARYLHDGLLRAGSCDQVYVHANRTQRTIATGRALADALAPGCALPVHHVDAGASDPLFDGPPAAHAASASARMQAAIAGRIGGDAQAWNAAQRDTIDTLQALLLQCTQRPCPADAAPGKRRLDAVPADMSDQPRGIPGIEGPAATASGITESLLMAWADGHDFAALGWRGLDEDTLLRVFAPHQAELALRLRAPDVARIASSQLAAQLLATLRQDSGDEDGLRDAPIGGDAPLVVLSGHDGTLTLLAGLLDLHWQLPGYQPDQVPPGGALVFERWRRDDGERVVRIQYVAQTLAQLRQRTPLTLLAPPASAAVHLPGCSDTGASDDCPLPQFIGLLQRALDPAFVQATR
jgi:4-phytase / acid phosphatase